MARDIWKLSQRFPGVIELMTFSIAFQILYLTEPETWTAAAMYQATRIFSSNLNAKMAQR